MTEILEYDINTLILLIYQLTHIFVQMYLINEQQRNYLLFRYDSLNSSIISEI